MTTLIFREASSVRRMYWVTKADLPRMCAGATHTQRGGKRRKEAETYLNCVMLSGWEKTQDGRRATRNSINGEAIIDQLQQKWCNKIKPWTWAWKWVLGCPSVLMQWFPTSFTWCTHVAWTQVSSLTPPIMFPVCLFNLIPNWMLSSTINYIQVDFVTVFFYTSDLLMFTLV